MLTYTWGAKKYIFLRNKVKSSWKFKDLLRSWLFLTTLISVCWMFVDFFGGGGWFPASHHSGKISGWVFFRRLLPSNGKHHQWNKNSHGTHRYGQIFINSPYFTNLDFFENISLPKGYLLGIQVVWARYNLTKQIQENWKVPCLYSKFALKVGPKGNRIVSDDPRFSHLCKSSWWFQPKLKTISQNENRKLQNNTTTY